MWGITDALCHRSWEGQVWVTCGLQQVQQLLSLRILSDLNDVLLHVAAGSSHHSHSQKQIIHLEEISCQPSTHRLQTMTEKDSPKECPFSTAWLTETAIRQITGACAQANVFISIVTANLQGLGIWMRKHVDVMKLSVRRCLKFFGPSPASALYKIQHDIFCHCKDFTFPGFTTNCERLLNVYSFNNISNNIL